jgi:hypothetical protein
MSRNASYIRKAGTTTDNINFRKNYLRKPSEEGNTLISIVSGGATSSPSYGFDSDAINLTLAQADSVTKGIATFYDAQFDSASGLITLDTLDGGEYT